MPAFLVAWIFLHRIVQPDHINTYLGMGEIFFMFPLDKHTLLW